MDFSWNNIPGVAQLFFILYAVGTIILVYGYIREKMDYDYTEEQLEPKDIVTYTLIMGAVASGATLGLTALAVVAKFLTQHDITTTFPEVGISILIMPLVTVLGAVVLPVLFLVGALLLKALFVAAVFLGTYLIVKPLQAWGNFLNRVAGYTPENKEETTTTTPKE
mgnify:CR=1 FL=1|jgi:hypothetical protein